MNISLSTHFGGEMHYGYMEMVAGTLITTETDAKMVIAFVVKLSE